MILISIFTSSWSKKSGLYWYYGKSPDYPLVWRKVGTFWGASLWSSYNICLLTSLVDPPCRRSASKCLIKLKKYCSIKIKSKISVETWPITIKSNKSKHNYFCKLKSIGFINRFQWKFHNKIATTSKIKYTWYQTIIDFLIISLTALHFFGRQNQFCKTYTNILF